MLVSNTRYQSREGQSKAKANNIYMVLSWSSQNGIRVDSLTRCGNGLHDDMGVGLRCCHVPHRVLVMSSLLISWEVMGILCLHGRGELLHPSLDREACFLCQLGHYGFSSTRTILYRGHHNCSGRWPHLDLNWDIYTILAVLDHKLHKEMGNKRTIHHLDLNQLKKLSWEPIICIQHRPPP